MKKLLPLFIIAIFAFGRVAAQAIPDGYFNTWNTSKNWIDPVGYSTSNDQDIPKFPGVTANVTKVSPWNNDTTTTGFALQLKTVVLNGDTLPGYITNSVNNPLQGIGGVPYSGQPTGIEVWDNYTSSTLGADTGGMIVVFKKSGAIIGAYKCPLPPTKTNYPLVQFTFSPALTMTADTVIFAAVSSINVLNGKNGFAGSTLAISEVEFEPGDVSPADLNWDFDPWVGDTAFAPQGWTATFPGVARVPEAYTGDTYALALQTNASNTNNNGDSINPAFATTGIIGDSGNIIGGYPYTMSNDTLEFYYVYIPSTNNIKDSGNVTLEFESGTNLNYIGKNIGAASNYTHFEVPFNLNSFVPDSVIVTFSSSYTQTGEVPLTDGGSVLVLDNVQFASQPLSGVKPVLLANNSLLIYPNPAANQITVNSAQVVINAVRLDNILGETVVDKTYSSGIAGLKENIDVSNLASGLYFITITSGDKTTTGKIMVSR